MHSRYTVCCNHFKQSDYRNKASNFLNVTAVPQIFVPESERRTRQADEIMHLPVTLPRVQRQPPREDVTPRQEIIIELEDSGEKLEYQATTTTKGDVPSAGKAPEKMPMNNDKPVPKKMKLDDSIKHIKEEEDSIVEELVKQEQHPEEGSESEKARTIIEEEELIEDDTLPRDDEEELIGITLDELRKHYSKYTKDELIEFLVRMKVFIE